MAQVLPKALKEFARIHGYRGATALMMTAGVSYERTVDILQGAKPSDTEAESIAKLLDMSPSSLMYFYYDDSQIPKTPRNKFRRASIKLLMYMLTKWM